MNHTTGISILLAGVLLLSAFPANAQKGQGDPTGIAREPGQPPVETVTGELLRIETGPCENSTGHAYVGTHLFLENGAGDEPLNVHLGPSYAVSSFVEDLEAGQNLEVEVFRTEQLEANQYIAKAFTANNHTVQLRDDILRPFWAGNRRTWSDDRRTVRNDRRMLRDDLRTVRNDRRFRDDRGRPRGGRSDTFRRGRW